MPAPKDCTLYSGGARGAESEFGRLAEKYGIKEVNYTFEGQKTERTGGLKVLTQEELVRKDVSLTYVGKLLNRTFTNAEKMRKILQSVMYQIDSGHEIFIVGVIQEDNTVKGGTGWGAEFAKICNKPLYVFGQAKNGWFKWEKTEWVAVEKPVITHRQFTGTGTRFLEENGKKALEELFERSFG